MENVKTRKTMRILGIAQRLFMRVETENTLNIYIQHLTRRLDNIFH